MRTASPELTAHLQSETTSLATLWKLTRRDGLIFGFTDHDADITYDGVLYEAATGYTPSSVDTTADLAVDNLEVQGVLTSDTLNDEDLRAGLWDYCKVEITRCNWQDLTQGVLWDRVGRLGEVRTGRVSFTAELRGLAQNLQQVIGRAYTASCNADFGDARCGKSLASYTVSGSVSGVSSNRIFADSSRAEADHYFRYGLLTWTSGANDGLKMEVKGFLNTGGVFELQGEMPYDILAGDSFEVYAGCDKTLATCKGKFNNVINFRGFPHVSGQDALLSGKS